MLVYSRTTYFCANSAASVWKTSRVLSTGEAHFYTKHDATRSCKLVAFWFYKQIAAANPPADRPFVMFCLLVLLVSDKTDKRHKHVLLIQTKELQGEFSCVGVLKVPGALPVEPGHYMTAIVLAVRMSFIFLVGPREGDQYLPAVSISYLHGLQQWFPAIYPVTEPLGFPKSFPSSCDSPDQGNDRIGFTHYLFPRRSWRVLILL